MDGRTELSGQLRTMAATVRYPGPPVQFWEFTGKYFNIDGSKKYLLEMLKNSEGKRFYAQILNDLTIVDLIEI